MAMRDVRVFFVKEIKTGVYFVSYPADPLLSDTVTVSLHVSQANITTSC